MAMNFESINSLSGIEFELLCKELLEKMGFEVKTTKTSGDGGIDLVAYNRQPILSGTYIVQCKRYIGSVGEPIIRDLYGVITAERANKGILITTGHFTNSAMSFANGKPIELIDGFKLYELLISYNLNSDTIDNGDEETTLFYNKKIEFSNTNDNKLKWIYNYSQYKVCETVLQKLPHSWNTVQEAINILLTSLSSRIIEGELSPSKSEYDIAAAECLKHIDTITMYESFLCKYIATYSKSILYFLMGDLNNSYECSKRLLEIIVNNKKRNYSNDEILTITAIVFNHIQLCVILDFLSEAYELIQEWNEFFELRINYLKETICDDMLDWMDPDEDINDILEFIEEEKEKAANEFNVLEAPLTLSGIYIFDGNLIFYNEKIPSTLIDITILSDLTIKFIPFSIENKKVVGFKGFNLWNDEDACKKEPI